ncbi:MAG: glycosyltransferase family 2 protein, partial [Methanotrichaceae archaeon]|nr:glycosyltransferase family 2 protein [Methanotrichaceae archaeon]
MIDPHVSVIIVSFNSRDDLSECIPSLLAQPYPDFEIIVIDNNSADGTSTFVKKNYPSIKVIVNKENYGPAKGYNMGIKASRGKYVVLLNPDTVVEKDWLLELVRAIEADEGIAACQSRVLLYGNPTHINTEGNEMNYLGFTWCKNYGQVSKYSDVIEETLGLSVCSAILRRNVLEEIGFFDEDFFMYLDDTDLGLRMQLAGYKVVCNPRSIVYHKYKFTPGRQKLYYLERNRLLVLSKIYDRKLWLKILPIHIFMEMGLLAVSIYQGWFTEKVKSYAWIIRRFRLVNSKRKSVHRDKKYMSKILNMMSPAVTFEEIQNPILDKFVNPLLRTYYQLLIRPKAA